MGLPLRPPARAVREAMSDLTATVDLLGELLAYPTISTDPNRAIIDLLAGRLTAAGAQVEVMGDSHKANLWATLGPDEAGGVLLSGHTDVVPVADQDWTGDPFVMREDQGRLYGRGTCDMKGFVAAATVLANTLRGRTLTRPLHFAFTLFPNRTAASSSFLSDPPASTSGRSWR